MGVKTRLAGIAASVALAAGMLAGTAVLAPAANAAAVGCYGDYCSGKDPQTTGCGADARTEAWVDLSGARLELRWSPTCKTNWARWNQYPVGMKSDTFYNLGAVQDTGYTQTLSFELPPSKEGTYWSPMIYSPVHKVKAVALLSCGDMGLLASAFDCATNGKVETAAV